MLGAIDDCCWLMFNDVPGPVITELLLLLVLAEIICGEICCVELSAGSLISCMLLPVFI